MKGFIEVEVKHTYTSIKSERNAFGDFDKETRIEYEKELISISDIARISISFITLKTPYPNTNYNIQVKESYEKIKQLIKNAQ